MKKILFTIFSLFLLADFVFAGGIVTNTNQSAAWIRTMARDASVDVDAVFFNPAGLTHLEDGFYIQVNSQTISQGRTIVSTFPTLNKAEDGSFKEYEGKTLVPVLPTAFAVYKKGNFAFSGGFTVIGGGGSAEFEKGLPELEYQISGLPSGLAGLKAVGTAAGVDLSVSGYSVNTSLIGTSAYFGFQGGVTYKINDMLSVAAGARYVTAKNTYEGYIRDISLLTPSGSIRADNFINQKAVPTINGVKSTLTNAVTQLSPIPGLLQPFLGNFGGVTLDQAKAAGAISDAQYQSLITAGIGIGMTNPGTLTLQQYYDGINAGIAGFNAQITQLTGTAAQLSATATTLADKELNVEQTGSGFSPFFGIDLSLFEGNFGIAVKYEMKTAMNVTTKETKDDVGLFTDGEEVPAEIPAMLSVGLRQKYGDLKLNAGFHYYFDNDAKYGRKNKAGEFVTNGEETTFNGSADTKLLAGNSYEFAIGAQYDITDMFGLSAGFLMTEPNPNPVYQSALSQTFSTRTFGFGAIVHATPKLDIDLGFSMTSYEEYKKDFPAVAPAPKYSETYDKTAMVFALGVGYRL
jgi:long-chain fatty acid transport protein